MKKYILIFIIAIVNFSYAQVTNINVSVNIVAPYSPYIADYIGTQTKTVVTLIPNGASTDMASVYFKASIVGDNGVSVYTKAGYKPPTAYQINGGFAKILTGKTLADYFDVGNMIFTGVTLQQLQFGNGLPEGSYTICIQVFDYITDLPLSQMSPMGCSAPINIQHVDPPLPLSPQCGGDVMPTPVQNVLINWSYNPGVTPNVQYLLKIVPVLPTQNANDAINTMVTPAFFEKITKGTSYLYGPADPKLILGQKYAYRIKAYEPNNKVLFKNNGESEVCTFTYGDYSKLSVEEKAPKMFITAPNIKTKTPTISVSSKNKFTLSWQWYKLTPLFDTILTAEKKPFGKTISKYVITTKTIKKEGSSSTKDLKIVTNSFDFKGDIPRLFTLSKEECRAKQYFHNHIYSMEIVAYDSAGKIVDKTSNTFLMQYFERISGKPKTIAIKGKILYKFDDYPEKYAANNAAFDVEIYSTTPSFYPISKKIASSKTDINGNFTVDVPDDTTAKEKYLVIKFIDQYYYKPSPIPLFTKNNNGTILPMNDSVNLSELIVKALQVKLRVNVNVGFPEFVYDTLENNFKKAKYDVDLLNPNASIPNGLPIVLYRKVKAPNIPNFEGQGTKNSELYGEKIIAVAEAKLQTETVNGKTIQFVNFEKLLCNFGAGDEYFIKALVSPKTKQKGDLTKYQITENKKEDWAETIEAPVQLFKFTPVIPKIIAGKPKLIYQQTIDYKLISTQPPKSTIKGKLVYQWASDKSQQLYPFSNAKFSIRQIYLVNGERFEPVTKDACNLKISRLKDNNGGEIWNYDNNLVVGIGQTDAGGNFEIKVVNHNAKGTIAAKGNIENSTTNICKENEKAPAKTPAQIIKAIKEEATNPIDQLSQGQLDYTDDMTGGAKGKTIGEVVFGAKGLENLTGKLGNGAKNGPQNKMNQKGGPAMPYDDEYLELENLSSPSNAIIDRVYELVLENGLTFYYSQPSDNKSQYLNNQIVLNAFEKIDIGTLKSMVIESKAVNKVVVHDSKGKLIPNFTLPSSVFVVFRDKNANTDKIPNGEGSASHPIKGLLKSSNQGNEISNNTGDANYNNLTTENQTFEWVIDQQMSLSSGATNQVILSQRKLLENYNDYYVQISPNGQSGQSSFKSAIFPMNSATYDIYLTKSRVKGRIQDGTVKNTEQGGLKGAYAELKLKSGFKFKMNVDKDGYFEFINGTKYGFLKINWQDDDELELSIQCNGYKTKTEKISLLAEGRQFAKNFLLEPLFTKKGKVIDEKGNGVVAFIVREDKSVYKTDEQGVFSVPYATAQTFKILPQDVGYFDTILNVPFSFISKQEPVLVASRLHRVKFVFVGKNGSKLTSQNLEVKINNNLTKTSVNGEAYFEFKNVSINNYSVLIKDKNNEYIPKLIDIKSNETKVPEVFEITMKIGSKVAGNVTLDGSAVKGAKVFIKQESGNKAQMAPKNITKLNTEENNGEIISDKFAIDALETFTDASGNYIIYGIPENIPNLKIYATHSIPNKTINGDNKEVNMTNGIGKANLALSTFNGPQITDIWNFPIAIESIVKSGNDYLVSGSIDLSKNQSGFSMYDVTAKYKFSNVKFKVKNDLNKFEPAENNIELSSSNIKLKLLNKYNINLTTKPSKSWKDASSEKLIVTNNKGIGEIKGAARMVDNSFNFPNTYLNFNDADEFFLCEMNGNNADNKFSVLKAKSDGSNAIPTYNLCDYQNSTLDFNFIEFSSFANPKNSYIDKNGKINLDATMQCEFANASPSKLIVKIGKLVLDNNKIDPTSNANPIDIKLEDWTLSVKDWVVSPEKGGLYSNNALLKTGVVDIPVREFNLTSQLFYMAKYQLTNLQLGGGLISLSDINSKPSLVYDQSTGSDFKPHWKLIIAGLNGKPAAKINEVSPWLGNAIDIEFIQLISKGKDNIISLRQPEKGYTFYNNPFVKFMPSTISSGDNEFSVAGTMQFDVPRLTPASTILIFNKKSGALSMEVSNMVVNFEGKGYVKFTSEKGEMPEVANGVLGIPGKVQEPGKMNPIPSYLRIGGGENKARIYLANNTTGYGNKYFDKYKNFELSLTSGGKIGSSLLLSNDISKNGMSIVGSDWDNLKFSGTMKQSGGGEQTIKSTTIFDFTVYGEIKANSSKLEMTETSIGGLGAISLSYDFNAKRLLGTMHIDQKDFESWKLEGVDFEMMIDPDGFYLMGVGKLNTGVLIIEGLGSFSAGFVIGNHPLSDNLINKLTQFNITKQSCGYLQANKNTFKGVFFTGGYNIIDFSKEIDLVLASAAVNAKAGIDGTFAINLASGATSKLYVGLGAAVNASASLGAITGTSLCASSSTTLNLGGGIKSLTEINIDGGANINMTGCIKQWTPIKDLKKGVSIDCGIDLKFDTSQSPKFDYKFHLDFNKDSNDPCKAITNACGGC